MPAATGSSRLAELTLAEQVLDQGPEERVEGRLPRPAGDGAEIAAPVRLHLRVLVLVERLEQRGVNGESGPDEDGDDVQRIR